VKPLADKVGASLRASLRRRGQRVGRQRRSQRWKPSGVKLDFIVHAIGFSDKSELKGLYADTSRDNFIRTMVISCYLLHGMRPQAQRR
jgi:enoyl-[acyl-carrier protein] reductase I